MNGVRLNERIRGTGSGEPLGVLNAVECLIVVSKETVQSPDTILGDNIANMMLRSWSYQTAVWLANGDTRSQLIQATFSDVQLYQFSRVEGQPDTLAGRPIFYSGYMPTLGDQGDLLLGAWSEFLDGLYQPFQSAESVFVRWIQHEHAFKFWMRGDGRPWWTSTLTPRIGAATQSPFVVLEERA